MSVEIKQLIDDNGYTRTFAARISFTVDRQRVLEEMGMEGKVLEEFLQTAMNTAVSEHKAREKRRARANEIYRHIKDLETRITAAYGELNRVEAGDA